MKLAECSANPAFKNKIVIEDPRTSSLGMGFLLWTKGLFKGSEWKKFWQSLRPGLLTVSPSWSGAYGLFLKGEADFVLSYTTSPAYHIENEKQDFIRAIEFEEGHFRQVEGVAVLKNSKQIKLAQEFVSVLLSPEVQVQVPKTNCMYPVKEVELPRSYALLPKVSPVSLPDLEEIKREKKNWLREWTSIMAEAN
jgi:thiamine transport system substrate-binding protein